jgi:hypothetical protein
MQSAKSMRTHTLPFAVESFNSVYCAKIFSSLLNL